MKKIILLSFISLSLLHAEIQREYYPDGKVRLEASYRDGKRDGIYKEYYRNGNLKSEFSYRNGIKDGMQKNMLEITDLSMR